MKRELTAEERANIVDRYQRGQSMNFICIALDRNRRTVKAVIESAGMKVKASGAWKSRNWGYSGRSA